MDFKKMLLYLLFCVLGFFTVSAIFYAAYYLGALPDMSQNPEDAVDSGAAFAGVFFGGTMWAWLAGCALGTLYVVLRFRWRIVFLWMPLAVPALYALTVIGRFS